MLKSSQKLVESMRSINKEASMPSNERFSQGALQRMLERQGFQEVVLEDLSENVKPMLRLFYFIGIVPYFFVWFNDFRHGS